MTSLSRLCRNVPLFLVLTLAALAPGRVDARGDRYIDITTSGYAGSAPLTNFPVLVRLSTAITGFNYTMCRPDGADLTFVDASSTVLPHEIDTWNTNGTSLVWVRVPELTATTTIRLFINEPGASPPAYTTDGSTWTPAGYAGVWHFASLSGGVAPDSIARRLDCTANKPAVSTGRVDGVVGNCVLNSDGTGLDGAGFLTTNYNGLGVGSTFTFSGWCRHRNTTPGYERVVSRKTAYAGNGFEAELTSGQNNKMTVRGVNATPAVTVTTPNVMLGNWYHLAFVYNGTSLSAYTNGALNASGAITAVADNGLGLAFGNNSAKNEGTYKGSFDEFRLLDAVASADWVRAEYDTVANPAFNAYSAVASLGSSLQIVGLPYNYGIADPAYGIQQGWENGHTYTCSVSRVWTNATEDLMANCTGWKRYGIDPHTFDESLLGSGVSNVMSYTHTEMERLEWHFARQFKILFAAGSGGSVTTNGGWYDEGSSVTVTAVADPNCTFYRWTGDVPAGQEKQATLVFAAQAPRSVTAQFALNYFVTTNGNDSADGRSWETARATLQSALADAVTSDAVWVSNGVYSVTNQIAITNGVWVRSVNGPETTVIQRTVGGDRQVLLRHPEAVFDGFTITRATGGAAYIDHAGTLSNCIISNNVSPNNTINGTVWLEGGGLVQRCRIINNVVSSTGGWGGSGGGVYLNGGGLVDSCIISNNATGIGGGGYGGGAYITGAGRLRNCLIARNNHILNAGGVYCNGGTVESCTIVDNDCSALTGVGGLYNSNGTILNSIIAYNNNKGGLSNHVNAGTTTNYTYSCTTPAVTGTGNTTLDPRFRDRAAQDYTLLPGPCVDTGANQAWMDDALDVAGGERIVSGMVDMGALESVPGALRCSFEGTPLTGLASNLVVFTAAVGGTNTTGLSYAWSFHDDANIDAEGAGRAVVTNLYWLGLHSVRLTVSNAAGETDTQVYANYILVGPSVAYVSTNGPSIYPYDTWAKAATNIHDAVDAGVDGTLVRVSNGVYRISRQIELMHNIAVRSVNGAGATEIRRESGSSRIFYLTRPEAVVDGFTLANANRGAVYLDTAGVVSNCIIRDNISENNTTAGGGVQLRSGGHVRNCQIINNFVNTSGGGGADGGGIAMYSAGLVENCVISNNTVYYGGGGSGGGVFLSGGRLRNCLVFDNRHINAGGVYCSGGIVENCTIASNRCLKATATSPGGLECVNGTILNTIIHDNWTVSNLWNHADSGTKWSYTNCSTWPTNGLVGSTNQDGDPLFRNLVAGDCRLGRGSPCINAGRYQTWMDDALDVAGQPRILNRVVDIGAYENPLPGGTLMILR